MNCDFICHCNISILDISMGSSFWVIKIDRRRNFFKIRLSKTAIGNTIFQRSSQFLHANGRRCCLISLRKVVSCLNYVNLGEIAKERNRTVAVVLKCSVRKLFTGKHLRWSLFLKRGPSIGAFCKYCKIFKNTYFEEHLQTAASESHNSFLIKKYA